MDLEDSKTYGSSGSRPENWFWVVLYNLQEPLIAKVRTKMVHIPSLRELLKNLEKNITGVVAKRHTTCDCPFTSRMPQNII
jgi:hypothetical protein